MKVLVTGAGLLFHAIKTACQDRDDHEIIDIKPVWDLSQPRKSQMMMRAYGPDAVVHTARRRADDEACSDVEYENTVMAASVVHHAAVAHVKKFVCFVPGDDDLTRDMYVRHLEAARDQFGMRYTVYRLDPMYGPNDWFGVGADPIQAIIRATAEADGVLDVPFAAGAVFYALYSADVANAVMELLDKDVSELTVDAKYDVTAEEVVSVASDVCGFSGEVKFGTQERKMSRRKSDATFKKHLPGLPFTPPEDGIRLTAGWFLAASPNVRL